MSVFFITGCRVSAVVGASVGHLKTDGVEHYLHVTEKRNKKRRKTLLDAARPVLAYIARAGIGDDKEGPLFRPMKPDGTGLERRHLDRKTPWRLVKKTAEPRASTLSGWAAAASAFIRFARPPSTTRSGMGPRCTRCASSPATPISARPRSILYAKRRTPRWRRGASTFASRDARAGEPAGGAFRRVLPPKGLEANGTQG